jgi:sigma-54 dependent transcriptional regulator, flagellar regulatory protein
VQRHAQIAGRNLRLDKDAMNCLVRNPWPGNVRELANLLERLAILFPDQTITAADLPDRYRNQGATAWFGNGVVMMPPRDGDASRRASPALLEELLGDPEEEIVATAELAGFELPRGGMDLKDHLSAIEIGLIRQALEEADGTVAEAARLLRMRRTTLVEKLRKYRLSA